MLNEDLVNLPNWLVLKLRIEGEEAIRLDNVEVLEYSHTYDIRTGAVAAGLPLPRPGGPRDHPAQRATRARSRTATRPRWSGR